MIKYINFKGNEIFNYLISKEKLFSKSFGEDINFIFFNSDSLSNRLELRRLISKNNPLTIVLVSQLDLSSLSWKANLLHFISCDENVEMYVQNLFDKLYYFNEIEKIPKKLVLRDKYETTLIDIETVLYCKADGNYSTLYLNDGKKKTFTIQLHKLFNYISRYPNIIRVGKSLIINLSHLQIIKKQEIIFATNNNTNNNSLPLSTLMIKRIKKELIWAY